MCGAILSRRSITEQWGRIRYRIGKRSSAQFDDVNRAAPKRSALFGEA
jgi:predicted DNA-binding WGR domain protein